ncbi:MAG: ABC transporter permease, partial [Mesorhizobium sp.]
MRCSIRGCAMDEARIARRGLSPRLWLAGGWLVLA